MANEPPPEGGERGDESTGKLAATYVSTYIMCTLEKLNGAIDSADHVAPFPPLETEKIESETDRREERKKYCLKLARGSPPTIRQDYGILWRFRRTFSFFFFFFEIRDDCLIEGS